MFNMMDYETASTLMADITGHSEASVLDFVDAQSSSGLVADMQIELEELES